MAGLEGLEFELRESYDCPILPGNERRFETFNLAVASMPAGELKTLATTFNQNGFHRRLNYFTREKCPSCTACHPSRIALKHFTFSDNQRRLIEKNSDLDVSYVRYYHAAEHQRLHNLHITTRGLGLPASNVKLIIENKYADCRIMEVRLNRKLVGACAFDVLDNGITGQVFYYDTRLGKRSLGTFMILKLIEQAKDHGYAHFYLGSTTYEKSPLRYKTQMRSVELRHPAGFWYRPKREMQT